jgi:hypothetical protein
MLKTQILQFDRMILLLVECEGGPARRRMLQLEMPLIEMPARYGATIIGMGAGTSY